MVKVGALQAPYTGSIQVLPTRLDKIKNFHS